MSKNGRSFFLGLPERILLFSAMATSLLLTFSSFYFPRVREIHWLFQDLSKKSHQDDSQSSLSETPTTYYQSLNGWFNTVSVEFAFFCTIYASVERCWAYPFPWIHDARPAEKERERGKKIKIYIKWKADWTVTNQITVVEFHAVQLALGLLWSIIWLCEISFWILSCGHGSVASKIEHHFRK